VIFKYFVICTLISFFALADDRPKWFLQDYKNDKSWGFFCQGDGPTEEASLASAQSQCANKICMLFGVEISSSTKTEQTLTGVDVKNTVIEKCPDVRVVGRTLLRKSIACDEPNKCLAFIEQDYPVTEYEKEYKRLDQPKISQVLEKQIIVREGNNTFLDPKKCLEVLKKYSVKNKNDTNFRAERIELLKNSMSVCKNLDYRNVNLQKELSGYLMKSFESRPVAIRMYVQKEFDQANSIEKQIEFAKNFEERQLTIRSFENKIKQELKDAFYFIFSKNVKSLNKIPLPDELNGMISEDLYQQPYMRELYSCTKLKSIVRVWPGDWDEEIKTCVINPNNGVEECEYLDNLRIRFQYMSCICRKNYPSLDQKCTDVLSSAIGDFCNTDYSLECRKKVTELLKASDFKKIINDL
jgi:hypothetical protein